ncbi:MAG: pantoate--beta-alanine ligase [Planctomycetota bacterium]|nr:pantoate--beta-alanine ligase [Planctomycetota bacterium]
MSSEFGKHLTDSGAGLVNPLTWIPCRALNVLEQPSQLLPYRGCALVPTMGALHQGHLSLVSEAKRLGVPVVVSIFVNPTQFGDARDFARYPRTLDADLALLNTVGVDAVFTPSVKTMYLNGLDDAHRDAARLILPRVATQPQLEDAFRDGHFAGVCQVVARLFDIASPAAAIFGEKDFQQLRVIEAMVEGESARWGALRILRGETIRECDGLAMSSRNRFLSLEERERSLGIIRALREAAPSHSHEEAERTMRRVVESHGLLCEYAVVRDALTLERPNANLPCRALITARIGSVRLIDNCSIALVS